MKYWFIFLLVFQGCWLRGGEEPTPNIVLFLIDDYGYGDISFEGNTQVRTPNIDRIAQEGVRMKRFYQSSAACAPTRASLLTGRYHLRTGVWGVHWGRDYIMPDEITLGDVFQRAGYATGSFGKWHSGKSAGYHSWDRGFDVGLETSLYNYFDTKVMFNNKMINVAGPITDVIGDQAVQFIERNKDRPFLCYLPFQSIHEPYNCPPAIFLKYKAQGYSDHVARLYGMIEVLDANVGKILNTLDQNGLAENTVVLFMVDDGPSPGFDLSYSNRRMNEGEKAERERGWSKKLRGGKASIWEGGSISPCYIRWPGKLEAGKEIHTITGVIDILPTLADICGIDLTDHLQPLDGLSFYSLLKDEPVEWPDRYYFDNTNFYQIPMEQINMMRPEIREISVLRGPYKYVRINYKLYTGADSLSQHLYNLDQDPIEEVDVAAKFPAITLEMAGAAEAWYEEILHSGRAFQTPVFQLGVPGEPSIFINGDAFSAKSATLQRADFRIVNWKEPGNSVQYKINVREGGRYRVEMRYSGDQIESGAIFLAGTEKDSVLIKIAGESRAVSEWLELPAGRQTLSIRLHQLSPNGGAIQQLHHLIVHREPAPTGDQDLGNLGLAFHTQSNLNADTARMIPAVLDFFAPSVMPPAKVVELAEGDSLFIKPFCDREEALDEVVLWLDFTPVSKLYPPLAQKAIMLPASPQQTLNAEFIDKKGLRRTIRLVIRPDL